MYKLLIVDDNPWDREGIMSVLAWADMGIEIIGACSNGKEALKAAEELKPDIIITDVAMPVMDGIDLVKNLKLREIDAKVIFMSSYDEFDFVRSAIDLDAYGYVLKPLIPEELQLVVNKVLDTCSAENARAQEKTELLNKLSESIPQLREHFLRDLVFGLYRDRDEIEERFGYLKIDAGSAYTIQLALISIQQSDDGRLSVDKKYMHAYSIMDIIASFSSDLLKVYMVQTSGNEITLVMFYDKALEPGNTTELLDIIVSMREAIDGRLQLETTIGISNSSEDPADIPVLYKQAASAANTGFYSRGTQIIRYSEIENPLDLQTSTSIDLQELYREVGNLIAYGDSEDIEGFVQKYLGSTGALPPGSSMRNLITSLINIIEIALMNNNKSFTDIFGSEAAAWRMLDKLESVGDPGLWITSLLKDIVNHLNSRLSSSQTQVVEKIREIIKSRYSEPITVNDITSEIFFSALHANKIFKKECGMTIFDYLTEYRMEKAKELLRDPGSKIYVVAQNVGYANKSHFCLVFKKYTGLSPNEFKSRISSR